MTLHFSFSLWIQVDSCDGSGIRSGFPYQFCRGHCCYCYYCFNSAHHISRIDKNSHRNNRPFLSFVNLADVNRKSSVYGNQVPCEYVLCLTVYPLVYMHWALELCSATSGHWALILLIGARGQNSQFQS